MAYYFIYGYAETMRPQIEIPLSGGAFCRFGKGTATI